MGRMTQDKSSRIMRYEDGNNPAFLNLLALAVITGINSKIYDVGLKDEILCTCL